MSDRVQTLWVMIGMLCAIGLVACAAFGSILLGIGFALGAVICIIALVMM